MIFGVYGSVTMEKTRLSLYYPISYLLLGGTGFLLLPETMLKLFLSDGAYSNIMVRLVGVMLISLGIVILHIVKYRIYKLYRTTLFIRVFIISSFLFFYLIYRDPLMIVLTLIVSTGFIVTLITYVSERKMINNS